MANEIKKELFERGKKRKSVLFCHLQCLNIFFYRRSNEKVLNEGSEPKLKKKSLHKCALPV